MTTLAPRPGHYVVHAHDEGERCVPGIGGCTYRPSALTRLLAALRRLTGGGHMRGNSWT